MPPSRKYGTSAPSAAPTCADRASASTRHSRRARATRPPRHCCRRRVPPAIGNALLQVDRDVARRAPPARRLPQPCRRAPDQIRLVGWTRRIVADEAKRTAGARRERQRIVQRDRLKDRPQLVIAVGATAEHAQREIDFRREPGRALRSSSSVIGWAVGGIVDLERGGLDRDVGVDLRQRRASDRTPSTRHRRRRRWSGGSLRGRPSARLIVGAPGQRFRFLRTGLVGATRERGHELPRLRRLVAVQVHGVATASPAVDTRASRRRAATLAPASAFGTQPVSSDPQSAASSGTPATASSTVGGRRARARGRRAAAAASRASPVVAKMKNGAPNGATASSRAEAGRSTPTVRRTRTRWPLDRAAHGDFRRQRANRRGTAASTSATIAGASLAIGASAGGTAGSFISGALHEAAARHETRPARPPLRTGRRSFLELLLGGSDFLVDVRLVDRIAVAGERAVHAAIASS